MSAQLGGTPVLILKEGSERSRGRDAQSNNLLAARVIAEAVRTTLGPRGMDKMLVDSLGDIVRINKIKEELALDILNFIAGDPLYCRRNKVIISFII